MRSRSAKQLPGGFNPLDKSESEGSIISNKIQAVTMVTHGDTFGQWRGVPSHHSVGTAQVRASKLGGLYGFWVYPITSNSGFSAW